MDTPESGSQSAAVIEPTMCIDTAATRLDPASAVLMEWVESGELDAELDRIGTEDADLATG